MSVARIPSDVRGREDLTLSDINRIVELRKARKKLNAKVENLDTEAKATREAIAANEKEEADLLAAD